MVFSIYTLSHPGTGEIFYVGCTSNIKMRLYAHSYSHAKNIAKRGKLTEAKDHYILSQRINPVFHVIEEVTGNSFLAMQRESFCISLMLNNGFPLLNKGNRTVFASGKCSINDIPTKFYPKEISRRKETGLSDQQILEVEQVRA